jgi:hypothetical protein
VLTVVAVVEVQFAEIANSWFVPSIFDEGIWRSSYVFAGLASSVSRGNIDLSIQINLNILGTDHMEFSDVITAALAIITLLGWLLASTEN